MGNSVYQPDQYGLQLLKPSPCCIDCTAFSTFENLPQGVDWAARQKGKEPFLANAPMHISFATPSQGAGVLPVAYRCVQLVSRVWQKAQYWFQAAH